MRRRCSREELNKIKSLAEESLTSREIAERLGRPEAGIRNIRYRLKLKKNTKDNIALLNTKRIELESQIDSLNETKQALTIDIESLVEKNRHFESLINLDENLLKQKIEERLRELKV